MFKLREKKRIKICAQNLFLYIRLILYDFFQAVKLASIVTLAKEAAIGVTFELPL